MKDSYAILRRPVLTEKSHDMVSAGAEQKKGRYTFEVHMKSTKFQIKRAIEEAFGVKVMMVNTMIVKPRKKAFRGGARMPGFTRQRKKAVVRLMPDSKQIELM
ncbi:MAG TPA: 50S ribosomal protein L23 [Planctomycetota bacterium]